MSFQLFTEVVSVAQRVQKLEAFLSGGYLTEMLSELGQVMTESGLEHLREAPRSPTPDLRVRDAASDLQTAYLAFNRAVSRGVDRNLRRAFTNYTGRSRDRLEGPIAKAAGSAALVALLRFYLGEPSETVRKWLDRVAKQLSINYLDNYKGGWINPAATGLVPWDAAELLQKYFVLERRLLTEPWIRPLPAAWKLAAGPDDSSLGYDLSPSGTYVPRTLGLVKGDRGWARTDEEVLPLYSDPD